MRRRRKEFFAEVDRELKVISDWLAVQPLGSRPDRQEYERIRDLAEDVRRRMDADEAEHSSDYQLWSSNRLVRAIQRWRAFGSPDRDERRTA